MISVTSGFLIVSESTAARNNQLMTSGQVEDGQVYLAAPMSESIEHSISKNDITIEKMNRIDAKLPHNKILRLYGNRDNINLPIISNGRLAKKSNEVALSANYIENNHLRLGDEIRVPGDYFVDLKERTLKIVGVYVSPDYNSPFQKNSDFMFDNINFGIGLVSKDLASKFNPGKTVFQVSYRFKDAELRPVNNVKIGVKKTPISKANQQKKKKIENDFLARVSSDGTLLGLLRAEDNKSINYMMDDMGGDRPMMMVLGALMVILIAFLFAVASSNKIVEDSEIIGTLLATGYRKSEILKQYMATPVIVTLAAALCGNILGYTLLVKPYSTVYYRSFNLPAFKALFNSQALLLTTVVPIIIMLFINYAYLVKSLKYSPLDFLRHSISKKKYRKIQPFKFADFKTRFRFRVLINSIGDYIIMAIGIFIISILLFYAFSASPTFDKFSKASSAGLVSKYQYILKSPVPLEAIGSDSAAGSDSSTTPNPSAGSDSDIGSGSSIGSDLSVNLQAEKFTISSASVYMRIRKSNEEISTMGISDSSRYFKKLRLPKDEKHVVISDGLAKKAEKDVGDYIRIKNEITGKTNKYKISAIFKYEPALTAFFPREQLNKIIGKDNGYFNGYLSNQKLNIDEKFLATTVDKETVSDAGKTLKSIVGPMLDIFTYASLTFFFVFIFILTKIIINKNRLSIAYLKIFGYTRNEISLIYIMPTTVVLILTFILSWPIQKKLLSYISFVAFSKFAGYFELAISNALFYKAFGYALLIYILVCIGQVYNISKINYGEVLKNRE
ncbi:MAG: ABC transporter permease [Christensenellales bacterium]